MGKVVALSSFESRRGSEQKKLRNQQSAEVILFTGVRYERFGNREEAPDFRNNEGHLNLGLPANSKS